MKNITTIILAAGKSKRFNSNKSKVLHEIAEQSMIDYVFNVAYKISKNNIVIVCNKENFHFLKKKFSKCKLVLQPKAKGTADAVFLAKKQIKKNNNVLVLFGDVPLIKENTIKKLLKNYNKSKQLGFMLAFYAKNPFGYGRVETDEKKVIRVTEEFQANKKVQQISLCNSGILICKYSFLFDNIIKITNKNIKKEKYLPDIFEIAYNKNNSFGFSLCQQDELQGINTRQELLKVDEFMQNELKKKIVMKGVTILQSDTVRLSIDTKIGKDSIIEPFVVIKKGVTLGKNVIVKSHSVLENCKVGDHSSIGPSARIRPNSIIGKKVKIGNFVEVKNSTIGDSTSISHLSYIGDSKIGKKVNIGAGTITCNYDGKNKNRTIIKDKVFVGSNVSLIAPLIIKEKSTIGAGSVITKNIPSSSLAIERSLLKIVKKSKKLRKNKI